MRRYRQLMTNSRTQMLPGGNWRDRIPEHSTSPGTGERSHWDTGVPSRWAYTWHVQVRQANEAQCEEAKTGRGQTSACRWPHELPHSVLAAACLSCTCVHFQCYLGLYTFLNLLSCRLHQIKQEAQLMLTNPCDAFKGQSRAPNSSIPYVSYSFLLCNSNFVFKTVYLRYSTSKNVVTLKSGSEGQGHWKWHHSVDHV